MTSFHEGARIAAAWIGGGPGLDVLAFVWCNPGEEWQGSFRVRYHTDPDGFDDEKHFHESPPGRNARTEMVQLIDELLVELSRDFGMEVFRLRDNDADGVTTWLGSLARRGLVQLQIGEVEQPRRRPKNSLRRKKPLRRRK
jgi:hypothetical protein